MDEWVVALLAFVLVTVVGAVAEYIGQSSGVTVPGAPMGYIVALFLWASPFIATESHYAVGIAVPTIAVGYLSHRRRGPR